jgi:DNA-binding transcriptional regulator YiaG
MEVSPSMAPQAVKAIRKRLGLSQAAFAAKIGVTRDAVARWEAGNRRMSEPISRLIERLAVEWRAKKRK